MAVAVAVVRVRDMRMCVSQFGVFVRMTVRALRHGVMNVKVVTVVVVVGMLMRQRIVSVQVAMRLGQMKQDTAQHDAAADCHAPAQ